MSEPVGNGPRMPASAGIPGNSHKLRTEKQEPDPRPKLEKVISGKVVTRKPNVFKRFARGFIADDAQTVGDFIMTDVVIPAVKNLLSDIINQGSNRVLYGHSRPRGRSGLGMGSNISSLRTRYDNVPEARRSNMSTGARARHDFREIVLESRQDALSILQALEAQIAEYGHATVADLYDLIEVTSSFTDRRWGWLDLSNADISQNRDGYRLDLPSPEALR